MSKYIVYGHKEQIDCVRPERLKRVDMQKHEAKVCSL